MFSKRKDKIGRQDAIVLATGLVLFIAIALGNITRWSIWFDEAFGIYMIRFSFSDIACYTSSDVHPPFYYWVLKVWSSLFGTSELALRSLSLVAMAGAMVFMYLILRRVFTTRVAAGGLFMMALSPLLVRYAEEARMYGLVALIVMAATYVLLRFMDKPTKRNWILYGLLVSLGMWTHYFVALAWLAHWAYRAFMLKDRKLTVALRAFFSKEWIWAHVLAVGLFLPWLPFMLRQMSSVQGGGFWIPPVTLATPPNFGADLFLYQLASDVKGWMAITLWVLVLGTVVMASFGVHRLARDEKKVLTLLLFLGVVPVILLIMLSMPPLRPAFIDRYLMPSILSLFALLGVALAKIVFTQKTRTYGILLSIGFVAIVITGITNVYATGNYNIVTKDPLPIRPTLQLAQQEAAPGEPFVTASIWRFYESHYYQTERNPVYLQAEDSLNWGSYDMVRKNPYRKVYDVAQFAREHGGKIWFIGDWKYGSPKLPRTGSWTVLREARVNGVPDSASTIRAVELQLKP